MQGLEAEVKFDASKHEPLYVGTDSIHNCIFSTESMKSNVFCEKKASKPRNVVGVGEKGTSLSQAERVESLPTQKQT